MPKQLVNVNGTDEWKGKKTTADFLTRTHDLMNAVYTFAILCQWAFGFGGGM